jgi:hypothetical protein
LSFALVPFPFAGGFFHAFPTVLELPVIADGNGEFGAAAMWPNGVVPCTEMWVQFLAGDSSVPSGIVLSNGVKAIAP